MPQSIANNLVHLVYSTKNRVPFLEDERSCAELYAYKAGILANWDCRSIAVGGTSDHLHLLFALSKNYALKKIVEEVKKGSSKWVKTRGEAFSGFYWQAGYGAFSVGQTELEMIVGYIRKQREHHRSETFQDEYRRLLQQHGIQFDERYVWD